MPRVTKPKVAIVNVPELGEKPPEWEVVQGAFVGQARQVWAQAVLRLLIGRLAEARSIKERDPKLGADESKYWDGMANAMNEVAADVLHLLRGQGERVNRSIREGFGERHRVKRDE